MLTSHSHNCTNVKTRFVYYLREEVKGIQNIFCGTCIIHISSNGGGSSGKEADSEGVEVYDKDTKEIVSMMKIFNPYMYEPEKEISGVSLSIETDYSGDSSKESSQLENCGTCSCGNRESKKREINCLYCQEVHTLNSQFDNEAVCCVTESKEFGMLFTSGIVLKNVLTRLHESKGDYLNSITCNRSLGYAAYKQFI